MRIHKESEKRSIRLDTNDRRKANENKKREKQQQYKILK